MKRKHLINSTVLLLPCIAVVVLHHTSFFYGYFGFDDLHYARLSTSLLEGHIDYTDHYSFRWPVLALTSLCYALFGLSDMSSALPALLLSCGILCGMTWIFRRDPFALLISFLLFFAIRWNVFYTDKLMPDVYLSFFLFVSWIAYIKIPHRSDRYLGVALSGSLLLAFMSKGTVILIVPLLAYYLLRDVRAGNHHRWYTAVTSGVLFLLAYGAICYTLTGDPLARFDAIAANSYYNDCSYSEMPWSHTIDRLTTGFATMIWNESLVIFLILAALARVASAFMTIDKAHLQSIRFHTNTIFVLFLSMNFMTFSLSDYNPGCLDIRHYIFCVPIMAASLGYVTIALSPTLPWRVASVVVLTFCLKPTYDLMKYSKSLEYAETKKDVQLLVAALSDDDKIYIASPVMTNLIDYYNGFADDTRTVMTRDYRDSTCSTGCYLLRNWYTEYHSKIDFAQMKRDLSSPTLTEAGNIFAPQQLHKTTVYLVDTD